jgi:hypothetical protein
LKIQEGEDRDGRGHLPVQTERKAWMSSMEVVWMSKKKAEAPFVKEWAMLKVLVGGKRKMMT